MRSSDFFFLDNSHGALRSCGAAVAMGRMTPAFCLPAPTLGVLDGARRLSGAVSARILSPTCFYLGLLKQRDKDNKKTKNKTFCCSL